MPLRRNCGTDEEVFEVDSGVAAPGGVEREVERHGGGTGYAVFGPLGDEALEERAGAEAIAEEIGGGSDGGLGVKLIGGELADEGEHLGDVGGGGFADMERRDGLFRFLHQRVSAGLSLPASVPETRASRRTSARPATC